MLWEFVRHQRRLTLDFIAKRRLNAPVEWLRPESEFPQELDLATAALSTDIRDWENETEERNLGVRLVDGYIELKIATSDDAWTRSLFDACAHLRVDARAAFGLADKPISSIVFKTNDPSAHERWLKLWPRRFRDRSSQWVATSFVASSLPTAKAKPVWRDSSPLPGSRLHGAVVVWRPSGKPASSDFGRALEDLGPRELAETPVERIVRSIAFATLLYWIRVYLDGLTAWDSSLSRIVGGWIARLAEEGKKINSKGKGIDVVAWAAVDSAIHAEALVAFLRAYAAAGRDLEDAYHWAARELERHPEASVPGWDALGGLLTLDARMALGAAFRAGPELGRIEAFAERYVFTEHANAYFDRHALVNGMNFEFGHDELCRRHDNEPVFSEAGRRFNPFRQFAASKFRRDVAGPEFFPEHDPGAILRYSPLYGVLGAEDPRPDEFKVFNIFRGWKVKPAQTIDQAVMTAALTAFDRLLAVLTQNNDAQIAWIKQWLAWIVQHPEIKQQSAIVFIGGQGIGKSVFGEIVMNALFGRLAARANGAALGNGRFFVSPYVGTLVVFIDEAKLESQSAMNQIKKLIRSDWVADELKFEDQRSHHVLGRTIIAANQANIGLSPEDAADRTLYFVQGATAENKRMTEHEFNAWAVGLKPQFDVLVELVKRPTVVQHLMRYLRDLPCSKAELEDLSSSSRDEEEIIKATASKARVVARAIVADARVLEKKDIVAPFTDIQLGQAIQRIDGRNSRVEPSAVLEEFRRAMVIEKLGPGTRFKWGYGRLLEKLTQAHDGWAIRPNWPIDKTWDWDVNEVETIDGAPDWRGKPERRKAAPPDDPDWRPPF